MCGDNDSLLKCGVKSKRKMGDVIYDIVIWFLTCSGYSFWSSFCFAGSEAN